MENDFRVISFAELLPCDRKTPTRDTGDVRFSVGGGVEIAYHVYT